MYQYQEISEYQRLSKRYKDRDGLNTQFFIYENKRIKSFVDVQREIQIRMNAPNGFNFGDANMDNITKNIELFLTDEGAKYLFSEYKKYSSGTIQAYLMEDHAKNVARVFEEKSQEQKFEGGEQYYPLVNKEIEILDTIQQFCNRLEHQQIDGLSKMKAIFNQRAGTHVKMTQLIELARWKKSDNDFNRFFHQYVRGRNPEIEEFYRILSDLDITNRDAIKNFTNKYSANKKIDQDFQNHV